MKLFSKMLVAAALLVLPFMLLGAEAGDSVPTSYSTQVSVEPLGTTGFVLKAEVKNSATGQVVAGPALKLPAGEAGDTETTLATGETVLLTATLGGASRSANYTLTVKRGDVLLSEHSAKINL